jgi:hypothetical protein
MALFRSEKRFSHAVGQAMTSANSFRCDSIYLIQITAYHPQDCQNSDLILFIIIYFVLVILSTTQSRPPTPTLLTILRCNGIKSLPLRYCSSGVCFCPTFFPKKRDRTNQSGALLLSIWYRCRRQCCLSITGCTSYIFADVYLFSMPTAIRLHGRPVAWFIYFGIIISHDRSVGGSFVRSLPPGPIHASIHMKVGIEEGGLACRLI